MLTETEFKKYCRFENQLSSAAIEYIQIVRDNPPSRMVGTHAASNVVSFVPSQKMGHTISTESRGPERAFKTLFEADGRCLEIWDQVDPVAVERYDKNGKLNKGSYTGDFLVLSTEGPCIVEVKPQKALEDLVVDKPLNWSKEGDDYIYLPAKKAFEKLGMQHKVFAYKTSMQTKVFNLNLLSLYREMEPLSEPEKTKINRLFNESFIQSMGDIRQALNHIGYDRILGAIAQGNLFFDIENELLSEAESVRLLQDERHLLLLNDISVQKIYEDSLLDPIDASKQPSAVEVNKVLKRLERIDSGESSRSVRRWRLQIKVGEDKGLSRFQSLISKRHKSGNRKRKIAKPVSDFLIRFLKETFAPAQGLSLYWGHKQYVDLARKNHPNYEPVSRITFTASYKLLPASFIAKMRSGRRGANAAASSSDPHDRNLKAQIAWERVAIDHYLADVYVIVAINEGEVYVERPWVSAMIDLATGVVLALTVSFRAPSRISCSKVIRECVRKHGKLPQEIIVDRGSDFKSVYFEALLAHYEVTLSFRPAAHGRYGGEVESLFGEFKKSWLSQRPGNLSEYGNPRSVDGTHSPHKFAILRAVDLYRELNAFCNFRSGKPLNIHIESRKTRFIRHEREFSKVAIAVSNNEEFQLATAVEIKKYMLDPQRGININELWYFSSYLNEAQPTKSSLDVRIDPENPHVIFAYIKNRWIPLYSSQISTFANKSLDHQIQEGLIAIEGANFRRNLREKADEELVRLVREMDRIASNDQIPIVECEGEISKSLDADELTFDDVNISVLEAEGWS